MAFRTNTFLQPNHAMTTTAAYMHKEETELLKNELKQLRIRIHKLEEQLKETQLQQASKQLIEDEIKTFLNGQFNNNVNKTLELYAEQYWQEFIAKNSTSKQEATQDIKLDQE